MVRNMRRGHDGAFKAKVALESIKGERRPCTAFVAVGCCWGLTRPRYLIQITSDTLHGWVLSSLSKAFL